MATFVPVVNKIVKISVGRKIRSHCTNLLFPISIPIPFSERKVQPNEYPHSLYLANYSTAAATCLVLRWVYRLSMWSLYKKTEKPNCGSLTILPFEYFPSTKVLKAYKVAFF